MRVGDDILCLHALRRGRFAWKGQGTDCRFEAFQRQKRLQVKFCRPGRCAVIACNHVYNQFIFMDGHAENLKNFEQTAGTANRSPATPVPTK